jgi:cell division protein ZipA
MDSSTLRLILIIVGAVFLLGLFLWERERARARTDKDDDWDTFVADKREPNLGPLETDEAGKSGFGAEGDWSDDWSEEDDDRFADDADDADDADEASGPAATEDDSLSRAAPEHAEADAGAAPELLIQLYVVTTGDAFAGDDVIAVARRCKLVLGDMNIFHRPATDDPERTPLFSMANLVKPGDFPVDAMDDFETPGLALFAQFAGDPSDIMVYDEMLHAARTLAEELGGEVEERGRVPLTVERAKLLRGQVLALLDADASDSDTE